MKEYALCTIVAKNYLSYARTLSDSFLEYHPDSMVFVLLVDKIDGFFDPSKEKFQLIEVDRLNNIEQKEQMFFKYTILELCTAVKPFFMEYIFEHYPVKKLLYLDPDILVTNPLDEILNLLNTNSIIITPHITNPISINDKATPDEITFMQYGIYNLGFIGLSKTNESLRFIQWWKERLWHFCINAVSKGLYVDQKWIDMVPILFNGVMVFKKPGYNVAPWNLQEKKFSIKDGRLLVNNELLYFFHFGGFEISDIERLCRYQTRYKLSDFKELVSLFEHYKELLIKNGYYEVSTWPYHYGFYDNGKKIEDIDRKAYWTLGEKVIKFGNPFATKDSSSFYNHRKQYTGYRGKFKNWILDKIIFIGLKHRGKIKQLPYVGRVAKNFYHNLFSKRRREF